MELYIKNEIERYKQLRKLWEIIIDTDHPLNQKVKGELSIQDITNIATYIRDREDEGIRLLLPKN